MFFYLFMASLTMHTRDIQTRHILQGTHVFVQEFLKKKTLINNLHSKYRINKFDVV